MTTIQLPVQDDLIRILGVEKIKKIMEEELEYQRFRLLEEDIQKGMANEPAVEWAKEFEKSREEAYKIYKKNRKK